jgi:Flp pilus assembly protein TadD
MRAYRQALAVNPAHLGTYTNLGRLLHQRRQFADAEAVYREGLTRCGRGATLLFNLALVLEDTRRFAEAADAYRAALVEAPDLARRALQPCAAVRSGRDSSRKRFGI